MSADTPETAPAESPPGWNRMLGALGVVSGMTAVSRVLGFARSVVIATLFSAQQTDAFWVAFRIPNLLRRLFAEGALTISFIPVFTEIEEKEGRDAANRAANITFSLMAIVVGLVTLIGIELAPLIARLFAPGFFHGPHADSGALTVTLLRILFPYIFLVCMLALCQGVLNARRHFFAPAAAPVILNICMIAGAFLLFDTFDTPIYAVAVGVLAGGVLQLALQVPYLRRAGFRLRPDVHSGHPAVRKMLLLMGPAAFGLLVYQLNILVSTILASTLFMGSVSCLFYANQLMELPLGIFAVAIGTVSLPTLSAEAAADDLDRFRTTLSSSLNLVLFLTIPAAVGYVVLNQGIVSVLFEHGEFTAGLRDQTGSTLAAFALGLPAIAAIRVIVQAFYALQDTRTPVKAAAVAFGVNIPLSIYLMGASHLAPVLPEFARPLILSIPQVEPLYRLGTVGLALATALTAWLQIGILVFWLRRKTTRVGDGTVGPVLMKTLLSAAGMLVVLGPAAYVFWDLLTAWEHPGPVRYLVVTAAVLVGTAGYAGTAWLVGHPAFHAVRNRILRRGDGDAPEGR